MKNLKKLLLVAVAALSFTACGSDDDDKDEAKSQTFVGTVTVKAEGLDDFTMDNVSVDAICDNGAKTCNIVMKQVTFAKGMADRGMYMDCEFNGSQYTVSGSDTTLAGKDIPFLATMNGQTGDFGYSVPELTGKLNKSKLEISTSISSQRGSYTMTFSGKRK